MANHRHGFPASTASGRRGTTGALRASAADADRQFAASSTPAARCARAPLAPSSACECILKSMTCSKDRVPRRGALAPVDRFASAWHAIRSKFLALM